MAKPTYGCQVTIQSEQERQMMKMHRREEKKERKRGKGADEGDCWDAVLAFDPREMRALRYVLLQAPPSSPLPACSLWPAPPLQKHMLHFPCQRGAAFPR